jgi:hypothetical protein
MLATLSKKRYSLDCEQLPSSRGQGPIYGNFAASFFDVASYQLGSVSTFLVET